MFDVRRGSKAFRCEMEERLGVGEREIDQEAGVTWLGIHLNITFVLANDTLNGIEAKSGTLPNSLRSKERFEDVGPNLRRDSRAIVADLDHHATILPEGADAQLAFTLHGIDRVVDDVGPDLIQLASEGVNQQRNRIIFPLYRNSVLQLMIHDRERIFQALDYVDILDRRLVHVGVFLDGADEIGNARCAAFDFVQ